MGNDSNTTQIGPNIGLPGDGGTNENDVVKEAIEYILQRLKEKCMDQDIAQAELNKISGQIAENNREISRLRENLIQLTLGSSSRAEQEKIAQTIILLRDNPNLLEVLYGKHGKNGQI